MCTCPRCRPELCCQGGGLLLLSCRLIYELRDWEHPLQRWPVFCCCVWMGFTLPLVLLLCCLGGRVLEPHARATKGPPGPLECRAKPRANRSCGLGGRAGGGMPFGVSVMETNTGRCQSLSVLPPLPIAEEGCNNKNTG